MAKNEFLPFAIAEGANVLSNDEYGRLKSRSSGFQAGVARSQELNKVWRQASMMTHVLAQFMADNSGKDILDDGDITKLNSALADALLHKISTNIPAATLKKPGIVQLSSATDSDSEELAATPRAVKSISEMVRGLNIRTVNNRAADDKGNIQISAGDVGALTKSSADTLYQPKGDYSNPGLSYTKAESDGKYQPKGSYAPAGGSYTKAETDGKYQPKGNYVLSGVSYTKVESDNKYLLKNQEAWSAAKLFTPRLINGVPFDGTKDISILPEPGAVTSYAFCRPVKMNTKVTFGQIVAGSDIQTSGVTGYSGDGGGDWTRIEAGGTRLAGTWKCLGLCVNTSQHVGVTLFVRIG